MFVGGAIILFLSPYWIVGLLILQTVVVALYLRIVKRTLWFSYILFLVFLGGILVIFTYVSRLISEERFETPSFLYLSAGVALVRRFNFYFLLINFYTVRRDELKEGVSVLSNLVNKIFSINNLYIYTFVVIYLLLALFCVANLIKSTAGPLRLLN